MAIYEDQQFSDQFIRVDGNTYIRCTFTRCEILFGAFEDVGGHKLDGCLLVECRFGFDGQAKKTIDFLRYLCKAGIFPQLKPFMDSAWNVTN